MFSFDFYIHGKKQANINVYTFYTFIHKHKSEVKIKLSKDVKLMLISIYRMCKRIKFAVS